MKYIFCTWIPILVSIVAFTSCSYIFDYEESVFVLDEKDKNFIINSGHINRTQIDFGTLAINKSDNEAISGFAREMVEVHSNSQNELKNLALLKNAEVPDTLSTFPKLYLNTLSAIEGHNFDSAYINHQINFFQEYVKVYENQVKAGFDQDLIDYANHRLHSVTGSLERSLRIREEMTETR